MNLSQLQITVMGRLSKSQEQIINKINHEILQLPLEIVGNGRSSIDAQTIQSGKLGGDPDRSWGMDGSGTPLTSPLRETDSESAWVVKYTLQEAEARGEAVVRGMRVTFSSRLGVDVDTFH